MTRLEMNNCNMILTEKQQTYQHLLSKKIEKYEYLTGEEMLPSDQRRLIKQAKFTYSLLEKASEKQTKTIDDQSKKQIKAIEDHGKHLVEFTELIKEDFNINRYSISHEEQKKYLMNLLEKNLLNFII